MTMKSIVISSERGDSQKWFDSEMQAIEFMQTMKNEKAYFEDDEKIYVEKDGKGYELLKGGHEMDEIETVETTVKSYELKEGKWTKTNEEIREIERERFKVMTSAKEIRMHDAISGGKTTLRKNGMTDVSPCGNYKKIWNW